MDSNNRFNYGSNSSANSGLKRSSGDSLYTNGSSMSFPPQGKNLNGEMNVNGATTVHGSGVPGPHPPAAPYPHVSNHHQSGAGYDYLWGGPPQYAPSMGSSAGHGMHQKQPAPGMAPPSSQHHFQGHGQYQLNGGVDNSHQSSVAGPPNMPHPGSQYWNRNNPSTQQMSYNSHSMFGSYQSPPHPGLTSSPHHKQQQSLQQAPHQSAQPQHIHPHRHQAQPHQQPQHYSMLPNGMPYYQHQPQHTSLPPPQHQQQQTQPAQPQGQVQMLQPAAPNFTPPRGSPQPHSLARGGTGSPLPAGMSAALMSPSPLQDSGSPKGRSPHAGTMGSSAVLQGHARETGKDVDQSFNGTERLQSSQILASSDCFQPKPAGPKSDYRQHSEQPAAQFPETAPSPRESVTSTPPRSTCHAPMSPCLSMDATPPRVPAIPALSLCPASSPGTPTAQCQDVGTSSPPLSLSEAPSRLSSSPVGVQGFRSEMPPAGADSVSPGNLSAHPSATAPGLPVPRPPPALMSASLQRSQTQLMTTQHDKPVVPSVSFASSAGLKSLSAGADPALMPIPSASSVGSRPPEPMSTHPPHTYHLSSAASLATVAVTSAAPGSPTAQPLSALPLPTTQASRTAPVSGPPGFPSAPPRSAASLGAPQSSNTEPSSPNPALSQASRLSSPEQEPRRAPQASVPFEPTRSAVPSESEYAALDRTPVRRSPPFHRPEHSTDRESFSNSSPFDGYPSFATSSGADVSSVLEHSSLIDEGGPGPDRPTDSDNSFHASRRLPRHDGTSLTEEGASPDLDTTRESIFSSEASRNDPLDSTEEGAVAETQRTLDSLEPTGGSILDSPLDTFSQVQDSSAASGGVSRSHSFLSPQPSQKGPEDVWENKGLDVSDSAGRISIKTTVYEKVTPPSFSMKDQNFIAFSTAAEGPAVHPLQPITDQVVPAAEEVPKSKTRKPRGPKALWASAPVETQRKPRVRTPKVEKTEEAAKGRKRKKPVKQDTKETAGAPGPPAGEVDPITATIEAVLANAASIDTSVERLKKMKRTKKGREAAKQEGEKSTEDDDNEDGSTTGESKGRRVATEEQVQFPLQHGWKREIRVKKLENRMKAETWYYTPCGRRMKQFPEIIKYLKKHTDSLVSREHFSFSPRMPVGDFYEERESPEGAAWVLLANEEVPSMIMTITGRRGRPPNPDKEKLCRVRGLKGGRRPGRPPKTNVVDLLSKVDAKLLKRLEAKEALTEEEKEKLAKIKKKMKRKARTKRMENAKMKKLREEKKKAKLEEESKGVEGKPQPADLSAQQVTPPAAESAAEAKKPVRRRSLKVEPAPVAQQTDEERLAQGKRVPGARSKAKALAKAQAEAEAAAQAAVAAKRAAERRAQAQKRLEERKRQQLITEELKKPTEDMCLTDHKPLPELSRIPGVVLSGAAFSHCLAVVEFLHAYGKLIGLDVPKDIPSLATLQEGLLGLGESQGKLQDLLMKLVETALHDPGLPSYYQSVKILGDKLVELQLTRSSVSEVLRIFLESHGYDTDVCNTMRTKTFHSLPPDAKAAILGFLVDELNGSNIVTNDIDNTLENMTTWRKNKWIIEGKLRKLKSALARRTGRSAEDMCFEERRRSARVAEEENLSLEESGLVLERGSRRARKEEPKLSDTESPSNASIPELERQIDKLTKRQAFFRKKLLQSSQTMRATLLGQDRYRRRYLMLPHLGGVLVEGPEELLTSGVVLIAEVPVTFLKKEPKVEENPVPTTPHPTALPHAQPQASSPDEDPLPDTTSLMCRPRGRGRPRKIKPEVELHLRTAKIRRRRRNSVKSGGEEGPGSPSSATQELSQNAFQSWLSHSQDALVNGTSSAAGSDPEESVKDMAEKQGQWFNLLPKQPCDDSSLTQPQAPTSPGSPPKLVPQIPTALSSPPGPPTQPDFLLPDVVPAEPVTPAAPPDAPPALPDAPPALPDAPLALPDAPLALPDAPPALPDAPPALPDAPPALPDVPPAPDCSPLAPPHLLPASTPLPKPAPATPSRPARRRRRGSRGSSPARRGARAAAAAKRRGRPPNSVFQELEQQYFTQLVVKPIPASMVRGWWWIKDPEELYSILQALHPRGVRERVLHKHLAKHMENLAEVCTQPISDHLFDLKVEDKDALLEELQKPWQVQEKTMETDISVLKWVEDLEQRVVSADLHLKALPQLPVADTESGTETPMGEFQPYTIPDPDSTRDDLQYYEHDANPHDDWIIRTKKEWSGLPRIATHPLDLAVLRLANLERNIERRYLKEPLWNPAEVMRLAPLTPTPGEEHPMDVISLESEITSRLRTWRQALDRCRSAPQVCLCLLQLEKAIAWERSVTRVTCQVCRKGDNDDCLLLCDGCDRGCHMYCLKPKITQVPEGDWFCPTCVDQTESPLLRSCKKRTRMKKKRPYEDDSSEDEILPRRSGGMATRHKEAPAASTSRSSAESAAKRRRMTTRNQPDLTFCEIILMEMEAHADAWPFLEPVNPRLVPGYRRIIKNPMDFLTMRERLLQGEYNSCEEFAADAQLVFNNCELFNEDTSEVGVAGHAMRRFFESRWAEFYSNKDK